MRRVKVEAAIGLAIAHDMTEVNVEKNIKQVAFRKRHVIQEGKTKERKRVRLDCLITLLPIAILTPSNQ